MTSALIVVWEMNGAHRPSDHGRSSLKRFRAILPFFLDFCWHWSSFWLGRKWPNLEISICRTSIIETILEIGPRSSHSNFRASKLVAQHAALSAAMQGFGILPRISH